MKMAHGLKTLVSKLNILISVSIYFILISVSVNAKTLKVDTVTPSVTDGDFTITKNGTGDIVIDTLTGVLIGASGAISASPILPVVNGGTGSSTQNFVDITTDQSIGGNKTLTTTGSLTLPVGTTAQRPTSAQGMVRYNTSLERLELYDGSNWSSIGNFNSYTENNGSSVRVEVCRVANSGTPTTNNDLCDTWISSITDIGVGQTALNVIANTFQSTPVCVANSSVSDRITVAAPASAILINMDTRNLNSTSVDASYSVICVGER